MSRSHETLDLTAGPPPEVLAGIEEAWERAQRPLSRLRQPAALAISV